MGWYFAPSSENGKKCRICQKKIVGKNVSQEDFEKKDFVETRDAIYLCENGKIEHLDCVMKTNENK